MNFTIFTIRKFQPVDYLTELKHDACGVKSSLENALVDLRVNSSKIRKVRISEKFCDHIFQCQKLTQKNEILTFFAYEIFEKVQN